MFSVWHEVDTQKLLLNISEFFLEVSGFQCVKSCHGFPWTAQSRSLFSKLYLFLSSAFSPFPPLNWSHWVLAVPSPGFSPRAKTLKPSLEAPGFTLKIFCAPKKKKFSVLQIIFTKPLLYRPFLLSYPKMSEHRRDSGWPKPLRKRRWQGYRGRA